VHEALKSLIKISHKINSRAKVKTKLDITWFAQKTNVGFVDQLNPTSVVAESKHFSFVYAIQVLRECSEDEDSFHYSIRSSTTKVDLGVEFLSSDEEN
jgi:hypothetical protein